MSEVFVEDKKVIRPDITVYKDHEPQLLLEVKARKSGSADWAAKYRRNLLTHFYDSKALYFMLVLPEKTFLWSQNVGASEERLPDYTFSTTKLFSRYLNANEQPHLHESSLELMAKHWLDRVSSQMSDDASSDIPPAMLTSGLYDALHGGTVALN